MTTSQITLALYNSAFIVFSCSVLFYGIVASKHSGKRKNDKVTTTGLLLTFVGLSIYFFWTSLWRDAHASRDASVWMIDHPIQWISVLMASSGSIVTLKGLTDEYWIFVLFIGIITFVFNLIII